jgi:hypothetical protein
VGFSQALVTVIPATQEAEISRITVQSQPRQIVHETLSQKHSNNNNKKPIIKKGLVERLKVKALSSNPSASRKRKILNRRHASLKPCYTLACF